MIENLTYAKLVNAKYLILYIRHQSSFSDANHYLKKKKKLGSQFFLVGARFLYTALAVQSTKIKFQSFFLQNTEKKYFNSHSDLTSLKEKYQDNFRLQRSIPLLVVRKSFNQLTERFSRCIKYLFLISWTVALDDLNINILSRSF